MHVQHMCVAAQVWLEHMRGWAILCLGRLCGVLTGQGMVWLVWWCDRLSEMAVEEEPIEIMYSLKLKSAAVPVVYEALVQVQDKVMEQMLAVLPCLDQGMARAAGTQGKDAMVVVDDDEATADDEMAALVAQVESHKRRRDFMAAMADAPVAMLHELVSSLALDLATIRQQPPSRCPLQLHTHLHTPTPARASSRMPVHAYPLYLTPTSVLVYGQVWRGCGGGRPGAGGGVA